MNRAPIRVFLADHHPLVRLGLRKLLDREADVVVVGEADDVAGALAGGPDGWDVLVLDISRSGASRALVLRRLRERWPALKVVVLSTYAEDPYGPRMVAEGATAYVSKDRPADDVVAAIRGVHAGRPWPVDGPDGSAPDPRLPHRRLSPREYQVFTLLLHGRTVSEIAVELEISASTTSNHVGKIREKLDVRSIAEIVGYAHRAGLVGEGGEGPGPE